MVASAAMARPELLGSGPPQAATVALAVPEVSAERLAACRSNLAPAISPLRALCPVMALLVETVESAARAVPILRVPMVMVAQVVQVVAQELVEASAC